MFVTAKKFRFLPSFLPSFLPWRVNVNKRLSGDSRLCRSTSHRKYVRSFLAFFYIVVHYSIKLEHQPLSFVRFWIVGHFTRKLSAASHVFGAAAKTNRSKTDVMGSAPPLRSDRTEADRMDRARRPPVPKSMLTFAPPRSTRALP